MATPNSPMDCFLKALITTNSGGCTITTDNCAGHGNTSMPNNQRFVEQSLSGLSVLTISSTEEARVPPRWKSKRRTKRFLSQSYHCSTPLRIPHVDSLSAFTFEEDSIQDTDEMSLSEEPELPLLQSRWDESSISSLDCSPPSPKAQQRPTLPSRPRPCSSAVSMGSGARFRPSADANSLYSLYTTE